MKPRWVAHVIVPSLKLLVIYCGFENWETGSFFGDGEPLDKVICKENLCNHGMDLLKNQIFLQVLDFPNRVEDMKTTMTVS